MAQQGILWMRVIKLTLSGKLPEINVGAVSLVFLAFAV